MPTYEYLCEKCGHHFDQYQRISDDSLTECPKEECKGPIHRVISSGAGFLFKGSGFYITDYRSDSYKKSAESEKPAAPVEKKSESTAEIKKTPETKTPEKKASTSQSE